MVAIHITKKFYDNWDMKSVYAKLFIEDLFFIYLTK